MSNKSQSPTEDREVEVEWRVKFRIPLWVKEKILFDAQREDRRPFAIIGKRLKERYENER